ncbi:hypothetical protein GKZ90_0014260 [Flavobacterium sp. MC2016-06]|jgi:hypothetical protein|uniref:hypothetical protein n=1 Tax=Flavobacterium sp. MC2016-06 TaxID=2676308 RepID=UPI0012BB0194|nr:hypothetical protein [Flavobacterium sp. MC2016-06]MBU3859181.1 hypothetical protein [Flavobacterium sp. MC2016-06]
MTKIKLGILTIFIVTISFISCSKDTDSSSIDENSIAGKLKFLNANDRISTNATGKKAEGDIIIVQWDEWGRASKNCGGWGLCNAEWFPIEALPPLEEIPPIDEIPQLEGKSSKTNILSSTGGSTILEFDSKINKYYIDILLAESAPTDISASSLTFKIDKDFPLDLKSKIGKDLVFHNGSYLFDKSLGNFGGYRIYLD